MKKIIFIACCLFSSVVKSSVKKPSFKGYLNLKTETYQKDAVVNKFEDLMSFDEEETTVVCIQNCLKALPAQKRVDLLTKLATTTLDYQNRNNLVINVLLAAPTSRLQENKALVAIGRLKQNETIPKK